MKDSVWENCGHPRQHHCDIPCDTCCGNFRPEEKEKEIKEPENIASWAEELRKACYIRPSTVEEGNDIYQGIYPKIAAAIKESRANTISECIEIVEELFDKAWDDPEIREMDGVKYAEGYEFARKNIKEAAIRSLTALSQMDTKIDKSTK